MKAECYNCSSREIVFYDPDVKSGFCRVCSANPDTSTDKANNAFLMSKMYHPLGSLVTVYHENGRANFEGIVSGFELETNSYKIFVNGEHVFVKSELID